MKLASLDNRWGRWSKPKEPDVDGALLGTDRDNPEVEGLVSNTASFLAMKCVCFAIKIKQCLEDAHLSSDVFSEWEFLTRPWFLLSFSLQWQVPDKSRLIGVPSATSINLSRPLEWTYGCIVEHRGTNHNYLRTNFAQLKPRDYINVERHLGWVAVQLNPVVVDVIIAKLVSI